MAQLAAPQLKLTRANTIVGQTSAQKTFLKPGTKFRAPLKKTRSASSANRARQRFTGACRPVRRMSNHRRKAMMKCGKQFIPGNKPVADRAFSRGPATRLVSRSI